MSGRAARLIYLKNGRERSPQLIIFWSYFWFKRRREGLITHIKGPLGCRIHVLLLLCQFGTQTFGMEGIRNDLPLSFLYVFSCWRWDSVQRSAFLGSKKIRICERKEGEWRERDGEWNWGFMKLTVSSLWRFSVKLHVLITQAFILVIICTNRNWFSDIF